MDDGIRPQTPFGLFADSGILVTGNARSGTTLMVSLLDGHPGAMTLPVETKFSTAIREPDPVAYLTRERCLAQMKEQTHRGVPHQLEYRRLLEDFTAFSKDWKDHRTLFLAVIYAFHLEFVRLGMDSGRFNYWVEKTPAHYKIFEFFKSSFRSIKNIHMVRNPFDLYASWKNRQPGNTMELLFKELRYSMKHSREHCNDTLTVRYEDLVTNTECAVGIITSYLDIENVDSLRTPTVLGRFYKGNSSHERKFSSISKDSLYSFHYFLNKKEIDAIKDAAGNYIEYFGYDFLYSLE